MNILHKNNKIDKHTTFIILYINWKVYTWVMFSGAFCA